MPPLVFVGFAALPKYKHNSMVVQNDRELE